MPAFIEEVLLGYINSEYGKYVDWLWCHGVSCDMVALSMPFIGQKVNVAT
jgi:hypothetical protein